MNIGRNELLEWLNEKIQTQYNSIEMLGDGIGYCQLMDAINPGSINISRLNLSTKYPDDCIRNLKLLQTCLKKLCIRQPVCFEKIGRGRFQDNITFLQWIYTYVNKYPNNLQHYQAYQRRIAILKKQGKQNYQMNSYLIPNSQYMDYQQEEQQQSGQQQYDIQNTQEHYLTQNKSYNSELQHKISQINEYVHSLQNDLKDKMGINWKLMRFVDRSIEQRNSLSSLLQQIAKIVGNKPESQLKQQILQIIYDKPQQIEQ